MNKHYDCIVIGAGPAGISSCLYLQETNLKTLLIEKNVPGGRILQTSQISNYAGFKGNGADLALQMFSNVDMTKIDFLVDEVEKLTKEDLFLVKTKNDIFTARFVILATGFVNKVLVPTQEDFLGRGVSYCALCDASLAKDKTILIYGNGAKATEELKYLATLAKHIYLVTNSINVAISNVEPIFGAKLERFEGSFKLTSVTLDNGQKLDVDMAFLYTGYLPSTKMLDGLDVLNKAGLLEVDASGETKIKGLYAAGDVTNNNLKQVATAVASGAICASSVIKEATNVIR